LIRPARLPVASQPEASNRRRLRVDRSGGGHAAIQPHEAPRLAGVLLRIERREFTAMSVADQIGSLRGNAVPVAFAAGGAIAPRLSALVVQALAAPCGTARFLVWRKAVA
jgi:hypothetical protein